MKKTAIILVFLFPAYLFCQNAGADAVNRLITKAATDTARIELMLKKVSLLSNLNPDSAIVLANEIIAQSQKIGYKEGEEQALTSRTKLYALKRSVSLVAEPGNTDSLYVAAMKAAELARKNSDRSTEAYNLALAAESLARQHKFEEAEGMGMHAIGLLDSADVSYNVYQVYATVGSVYFLQDKYELAIEYIEEAFTKLKGLDFYQPRIASGYQQLSRCYENTGLPLKALEAFKIYTAISDSLAGKENVQQIAALKLGYNSNSKQQEVQVEQAKRKAIKKAELVSLLVTLGAMLMLTIAAISAYRIKQKAATLLNNQKEGIENTLSQLNATQTRLVESEKMASLGEVAVGIVHEIQKTLSVVNELSGKNTKLIEELKNRKHNAEGEKNKEAEDLLIKDIGQNIETIAQQGKRADTIVKNILQHSPGGGGRKELTDINVLADEYLRIAYHGAKARDKTFKVIAKTNFEPSIGKINVIPQEIGKVILSILSNAFYTVSHKASGEETKQAIKRGYDPIVWVRTKRSGAVVEISITDNGNGIPEEIRDSIFEPFFTTKPAGQGTGLGLSLAYDIVKAHGGDLKVETKEGEGSEFIILLPLK